MATDNFVFWALFWSACCSRSAWTPAGSCWCCLQEWKISPWATRGDGWTCRRKNISPGMFFCLLVLMGRRKGTCAAAWCGLEENGLAPRFLLLPFLLADWLATAGICEALLCSTVGRLVHCFLAGVGVRQVAPQIVLLSQLLSLDMSHSTKSLPFLAFWLKTAGFSYLFINLFFADACCQFWVCRTLWCPI